MMSCVARFCSASKGHFPWWRRDHESREACLGTVDSLKSITMNRHDEMRRIPRSWIGSTRALLKGIAVSFWSITTLYYMYIGFIAY